MKINQMPVWAAGLLLTVSLLTSCENNLQEKVPAQQVGVTGADSIGIIKKGKFKGNPITYTEIDGNAIWQGDILLTPEQLADENNARTEGAGLANKDWRWQNWSIPYTISNNMTYTDEKTVEEAIRHWESWTPLRFVQRTNQKDYIHFGPNNLDYSYSSLGRVGGQQLISLVQNVSLRSAIHEIGHAVGLLHEHTRFDRDNYVTIHWENIEPKMEGAFTAYKDAGIDGFDYGVLDYNSVMMYSPLAFSKNGQPTISRNDGKTLLPGNGLSGTDIRTVISMYSNIYIIRNGILNAVDLAYGTSTRLSEGWGGAAKTLAENDDHIWGIQGGGLWKTFRLNGGYERVGTDDWTGAKGLTGQDAQGNFYAVYANKIWKINKYGQRSKLPGLTQWGDTQAIYYHNNALYVVWLDKLYKVNTSTGAVEKTYNGVSWFDVRGIAAMRGSSDDLYVMRKDALFRVNVVTGAITGGENFADVKAMTGVAGYLFIVSGGNLIRLDDHSNKQIISKNWEGTESIGSTRNPNLF